MMNPDPNPQRIADPAPSMACVDSRRLRHCGKLAYPVSKVLDDDNLLVEIMVRLGFPTTLVHAALVCKRWFLHASNPAFLRRFRKLHPPRILGFYVHNRSNEDIAHFVPMLPQPPELEVVIRHANFILDAYKSMRIHIDIENHSVSIPIRSDYAEAVHNLLSYHRGIPQLPPCQLQHGSFCTLNELVFKEEGDSLSYFYVWIESTRELTNTTVHVYTLQDGSWCRLTSIIITNLNFSPRARRPLFVGNKIYVSSDSQRNILALDLTNSSFSIIQLPQGVEYHIGADTMLSRDDDDSGVYLIHANKLQLSIWRHKTDNWLLVDTICLTDLFVHLRVLDHTFEDGHVNFLRIRQVGKNVEYVFLQLGRSLLYLDIKCRALRKVYGVARDAPLPHIHPLMMIWPPTFSALKDDHASDAT